MGRLYQVVLIASTLGLSWLGMQVVHELGHVACAGRFPDGGCRVVPGLGHGGDGFIEHARDFLDAELGDWAG